MQYSGKYVDDHVGVWGLGWATWTLLPPPQMGWSFFLFDLEIVMWAPVVSVRIDALQPQAGERSTVSHGEPESLAGTEVCGEIVPLSTDETLVATLLVCTAEIGCTPATSDLVKPGWLRSSGWRIGPPQIRIWLP